MAFGALALINQSYIIALSTHTRNARSPRTVCKHLNCASPRTCHSTRRAAVRRRDRSRVCLLPDTHINVARMYHSVQSLDVEAAAPAEDRTCDRCWSWCADPVVFGVLVDMDRGCVTFRLNDMDGPCVRFPPTAQWREGVSLTVDEFPREDTSPRVVISCATPPAPPSLLAAAANPLCVDGHLARGILFADGNARDHDPDGDY